MVELVVPSSRADRDELVKQARETWQEAAKEKANDNVNDLLNQALLDCCGEVTQGAFEVVGHDRPGSSVVRVLPASSQRELVKGTFLLCPKALLSHVPRSE